LSFEDLFRTVAAHLGCPADTLSKALSERMTALRIAWESSEVSVEFIVFSLGWLRATAEKFRFSQHGTWPSQVIWRPL